MPLMFLQSLARAPAVQLYSQASNSFAMITFEKYMALKALPFLECRAQHFRSKKTPSRIDFTNVACRTSQPAGLLVHSSYPKGQG